MPKDLQHSMALESIAEREKNARMTLAEAERDISEMLKDAADAIDGDADAMRLRTMHLAYESVKQSGGTLMVPSAFTEGFVPASGNVGGMSGGSVGGSATGPASGADKGAAETGSVFSASGGISGGKA